MKTYQLIQLSPLERLRSFPDQSMGFPAKLNLPDDREPPILPTGYRYVIVTEQPTYDSTTQKIERFLDATVDGWQVVELTPEEILERIPTNDKTIKSWQAKAALANAGLLESVEQIIVGMPDGLQKITIRSAWNNNADFSRNSPSIIMIGAALNLTDAQIDDLFVFGEQLVV